MAYRFTSTYFDREIVPGRVLDVFEPADVTRDVAVFFVHGGGWRGGSRTGFHPIMRALNADGYVCGSTDYRLHGSIQDQITDVRHGYALFRAQVKEFGGPDRVAVFGSSAGAHLALLLTLARPGECGEVTQWGDVSLDGWEPPAGVAVQAAPVTFEPWEEIFPVVWQSMQDIVGKRYEDDPEAFRRVSPREYIRPESPPVFLMEAENEHMFPRRLSEAFVARMQTAGCRAAMKVYPNAEHGFFYDVARPCQQAALADLVAFVESLGSIDGVGRK